MTHPRRWLRCFPVLGVCLLPAGPNARLHLLPEAGATQERRLEAVRCKPLLGAGPGTEFQTGTASTILCPAAVGATRASVKPSGRKRGSDSGAVRSPAPTIHGQ